jgi:hypothetical protein
MIFGIGLAAVGYSIFYWGVHHFPGWDCPTKDGCRYGLLELLGVPTSWNMVGQTANRYASVGLTPGAQEQAGNAGSQPQQPENQTTPSALTPSGGGWINSILTGLNAPTSFNNQNKCVAWNACEGNLQGHSGLGINNPFNITADSYQSATHGDGGAVNSDGVQSFSTLTAGITGTIAKINEPFARAIRNNLVNDGTFSAFATAVGSSGWGTSGSCIGSHGS